MEKNYYEWLEIDRNASSEVIEKAYKTLVKKYHPDLQDNDEGKKEAEEIIKKINEAYSVLSDKIKKEKYDSNLKGENISKEDYNKLKQELNNIKNNNNNFNYEINKQTQTPNSKITQEEIDYKKQQEELIRQEQELQYKMQIEAARQKAYHDAYIQDLKNRGYKIKYKKSFKDYLRMFITIFILIIILIILWQIPFIKKYFLNIYNSNDIIKFIIDIIINLINNIINLFKN